MPLLSAARIRPLSAVGIPTGGAARGIGAQPTRSTGRRGPWSARLSFSALETQVASAGRGATTAPVSLDPVRRLEKAEENRLIACTSHEGLSIGPGSCGRGRRILKEAPHPPASGGGGGEARGSFYQAWSHQGELASSSACALRPAPRAAASASVPGPSAFGICRSGGGKSLGFTPILPSQNVSGSCGLSRHEPGAMARGPGAGRWRFREAGVPRQRWFAHRRRCRYGAPRGACALRPSVIERVARRSDLPGEPLAGAVGWRRRTAQYRSPA
jgi:hypothetical protein